MPLLPLLAATAIASGSHRVQNRESLDFTLNGNRTERVQIVNGSEARLLRVVATAIAVETFGMARHVVQTDAAQRQSKLLLGG